MDPVRAPGPCGSLRAQRSQRLFQRLVSEAAAALSFSAGLEETCGADGVSFSQTHFHHLFRPTGALRPCAPPQGGGPPRPPLQSARHPASCRRTTLAAAHRAAHRPQILPAQRHLQGGSSPAQQGGSSPAQQGGSSSHPGESFSLKRDQSSPAEQVQAAAAAPPTCTLQSDVGSALDGGGSRELIQGLLAQLFHQPEDPDLVVSALAHLSVQTTLVRSLLAEQLNRSEWQRRRLSCWALSRLQGPISQDVVNKLLHLMGSDQHRPVRRAAAEALMKLERLPDVHSLLRLKLQEEQDPRDAMEALDVVVYLRLTTAALLQPLLCCFSNQFTDVRKQACGTAEALLLGEDTVVRRLLELMEVDPDTEVRLSAMTAVAALPSCSADVQEALWRCVDTEDDVRLRLAACRLLQSSAPPHQLQDFLLQRVHVEPSRLLRRRMQEMLRLGGCSLQEQRRRANQSKYLRRPEPLDVYALVRLLERRSPPS